MTSIKQIETLKINYNWGRKNLGYKKKREYQTITSLLNDAESYKYVQE